MYVYMYVVHMYVCRGKSPNIRFPNIREVHYFIPGGAALPAEECK